MLFERRRIAAVRLLPFGLEIFRGAFGSVSQKLDAPLVRATSSQRKVCELVLMVKLKRTVRGCQSSG